MSNGIVPRRTSPISITVEGLEVCGEISALYSNDMTVTITSPVTGLSSGVHIPYFAMGVHAVASGQQLTSYGRQTAERLLKRCYEYSQGRTEGWQVDDTRNEPCNPGRKGSV